MDRRDYDCFTGTKISRASKVRSLCRQGPHVCLDSTEDRMVSYETSHDTNLFNICMTGTTSPDMAFPITSALIITV